MITHPKSKPNNPAPDDSSSGVEPALVQRAVDDICNSGPFRSTRQCQDLLRYVVIHSLAGQDQLLRERVIGAEVFKRSPDYEPSEDPIVRNRAAEVRKRLAQYYQGANGNTGVRIDIPAGSYRATFEKILRPDAPRAEFSIESRTDSGIDPGAGTASTALDLSRLLPLEIDGQAPAPQIFPQMVQKPDPGVAGKKWIWASAALVLLAICAGLLLRNFTLTQNPAFRQFWAPLMTGPKPVLICMGSNAVYRLSDSFLSKYREEHRIDDNGVDFYANFAPGEQVDAHAFNKAWNSFVALGDVAAVSEVVAAVTRQGKNFQERFPPDVSFAELQNTPAVLIGGFNNSMALTLTKDLRYELGPKARIEDRQDSRSVWSIKAPLDSHDTEDYAIVSRILNSKTGKPIISVAGIGGYGTQAAAAFISDPQAIAHLAKMLPSDWQNKNIQLVLHTKVVDFRPISTEVVATYLW